MRSALLVVLLLLALLSDACAFSAPESQHRLKTSNAILRREWCVGEAKNSFGSFRVRPTSTSRVLCVPCEPVLKRAPTTAISAVQSSASVHESTLAGRIFPIFSKLIIDRKKAQKIAAALSKEAHYGEMIFMAALGWGTMPLARLFYERFLTARFSERFKEPFKKTRFFQASRFMAHAFQIGSFVYVVDIIDIVLSVLGFRYFQANEVSKLFAKAACLVWFMLLAKDSKKNLLRKSLKDSPNSDGKLQIYDRLLNAIIFAATFMAVLDALKVNMGVTLSSLLSLGGVGTLIVSLASKDLAEQLVSGLAVSTQDRFYSGDEIKLGDGTAGIVSRIGWTHTDIRCYDETTVSIPNSDIFNQRITNLSRGKRCQVKQALWFSYNDIEKMSTVCETVKDEIVQSCPGLITAGRPFRAHWRDYSKDHLELVVDCHFEYPPVGDIYWDNRQNVLEAIARATKKCGVEFSLPTTAYVAPDGKAPFVQDST